jgi:acyl-CoA synthetase (AMP-forming)/AMP-acid ligase II
MIIKLLRQRLLKSDALKISLPKRQSSSISSPNSSKLSYQSNPSGDFHLVGQTIQERLDSISHSKPNEMVYKFCATQTSFTFLELKQRVDELAQSFMQLGLQKGDRVAILLPNLPETVLSLYALAQIGCISVLMNPAYNIDEIEYMLKMTKSKAAIILDNFKVYKKVVY